MSGHPEIPVGSEWVNIHTGNVALIEWVQNDEVSFQWPGERSWVGGVLRPPDPWTIEDFLKHHFNPEE